MTRREQADKLLLFAIESFERDPSGPLSVARAQAAASIASAMLIQEMLDSGPIEIELDEPEDKSPW